MGGVFPFLAFLCVVPQKYTNDYLRGDCISYREGFRLGVDFIPFFAEFGNHIEKDTEKRTKAVFAYIYYTKERTAL